MMLKEWLLKEENIIKFIISISAILLIVYKIIDKDTLIDSVVLGLIEIQGIRQLNENVNLTNIVKLSPIGNSYVEIRESREKEFQENNT